MAEVITGSCNCGKVSYEIAGDIAANVLCHCPNCRKSGGGAFSVNLIVPEAILTLKGELKAYEDPNTDSGKPLYRKFCPNCGGNIGSWIPAAPGLVFLKAGTVDDKFAGKIPKPSKQVFTETQWFTADHLDVADKAQRGT
ncbi:Mss4-like protein [Hyaloraphidium curvatum]|nr:Mss4-like protein [Hyaloraphidium curvatum]